MEILVEMSGDGTFGPYCRLNVPEDCDMIVVCVGCGRGDKPVRILLPHQLRLEYIEQLKTEYPGHWINVLPCNHADRIRVFDEPASPPKGEQEEGRG